MIGYQSLSSVTIATRGGNVANISSALFSSAFPEKNIKLAHEYFAYSGSSRLSISNVPSLLSKA